MLSKTQFIFFELFRKIFLKCCQKEKTDVSKIYSIVACIALMNVNIEQSHFYWFSPFHLKWYLWNGMLNGILLTTLPHKIFDMKAIRKAISLSPKPNTESQYNWVYIFMIGWVKVIKIRSTLVELWDVDTFIISELVKGQTIKVWFVDCLGILSIFFPRKKQTCNTIWANRCGNSLKKCFENEIIFSCIMMCYAKLFSWRADVNKWLEKITAITINKAITRYPFFLGIMYGCQSISQVN